MYAHETLARQQVSHAADTHKYRVRLLADRVQSQVFPLCLHVGRVVQFDAFHPRPVLHVENVVLQGAVLVRILLRVCLRGPQQFVLLLHLGRHTLELILSEGFQQVVDGVGLVALQSILPVGRGEYRDGSLGQRVDEVQSREVRHVDVSEDGIHFLAFHDLHRLESALACTHDFEVGNALCHLTQLLQGQGFVVYEQDFYHISVV